ncbi:hypothetical protein LXA43DRAFT_377798 [Ganoderma leucocontextum]|nr:hypothetical protein LXA43DRAFT_377798 [Ganoderma leucocontextum]
MGSLEAIEFESFLVGSYCQMATIAFVLYEYIIITQDEIRFFWGKRLTGATVLFWLNKWIIILYYAISFATGFKVPDALPGHNQGLINIGCVDVLGMGIIYRLAHICTVYELVYRCDNPHAVCSVCRSKHESIRIRNDRDQFTPDKLCGDGFNSH